jgi:short-subunit dehydrogenase
MKIAVITGASSGMGREFARQLDADERFDEIWVVARRLDRLEALREELRAPVRPLALDLTRTEDLERLKALFEAEKPTVSVLVNAAGFGLFRPFTGLDLERQLAMIDLNEKALVSVTYHALPFMTAGSRIYNMGSLSAFQPVPYINVYGASKAFVLSFSRALGAELKPRGIRVMAVCPGWVRTEFFDTAVTDPNVITYYNRYYEAGDVVRRALKDLRRGKDVSVCGLPVRAQVLLVKLLPHRLVMRIWCRQQGKPV